ncbi:MAG: Yip1 family protein [Methanoregula sp.]|nr:Yip1 family protein [Methanoregula sp.]
MIDPIVTKVKGFLLKPVETFQQSRNDEPGVVFTYFAALLLLNAILSALIGASGFGSMQMFSGMMGGFTYPVRVFFMALAGGFILTLILAAWIHLWVYLFGGHMGIMQTFKAIMYGNTPHLLLGWIPFIGIIFVLWSLVLGILGIRELQEISTVKAILVIAIAVTIPLILIILFAVFFNPSNMYFYPAPGYAD